MSKISIIAVILWVIAAIFFAVIFDEAAGNLTYIAAAVGMAVIVAYWGYVAQRYKSGRQKRTSNIAVTLWGIAFMLFVFGFDNEGVIMNTVISWGAAALLILIGHRLQHKVALKNRVLARALAPSEPPEPPKPKSVKLEKSGDKEADRVIAQGNEYMRRLAGFDASIKDGKIRGQVSHLHEIGRQIFDCIAKQPEQISKLNTFMSYYFPTTLKFLENYSDMENKTVKGEHIISSMDEISNSLSCIEKAFEHQLDNLYSDKAVDISADVAVLQSLMKAENIR